MLSSTHTGPTPATLLTPLLLLLLLVIVARRQMLVDTIEPLRAEFVSPSLLPC